MQISVDVRILCCIIAGYYSSKDRELLYRLSYRGPRIVLKVDSVAGRPKECVCGLSVDGIVGSIPTGGME